MDLSVEQQSSLVLRIVYCILLGLGGGVLARVCNAIGGFGEASFDHLTQIPYLMAETKDILISDLIRGDEVRGDEVRG